jgi:hypothetical protein
VLDQRIQGRAAGVGLDMDQHADRLEPDDLRVQVAGTPYRRGIDVGCQLQLQAVHRQPLRHRVGMDANGEAGAQGGQQCLRCVGRGRLCQQLGWLLLRASKREAALAARTAAASA